MKKEKEFDMHAKIRKPSWYLMPIKWLATIFMSGVFGKKTKINKINCEGVKGPYLIYSNHASMLDFSNMVKATFPRRSCWVCSIEEFNGREWLFRHIGCIPKRKYTKDTVLIRSIVKAINKLKANVVIYPEARYSICGINERTGDALGKFAKLCKAPVIVFNQKGNFLHSPQWAKNPTRKLPCEADFICVATAEEVATLSAEELQERIQKAFAYDDFKWQYEHKYELTYENRAQNIHKVLYKCPICGNEHEMTSYGHFIECNACHSKWDMDTLSRLHLLTPNSKWNEELSHVPNWYKWEREETIKEVMDGTYKFSSKVRLEKLINSHVGFRKLGIVDMVQDDNGITLSGKLDDGTDFNLNKPCSSTSSIHIEYDFMKKGVSEQGDALDIATLEETYFVFPIDCSNVITKIHFATEALYDKHTTKHHE